jgi:adenylylsulfate kinase
MSRLLYLADRSQRRGQVDDRARTVGHVRSSGSRVEDHRRRRTASRSIQRTWILQAGPLYERAARMAKDIVSDGGIAVCALISPYRDAREDARRLVGPSRFLEVFVNTPLAVCEARDPKGLYRRYRRGELQGVSGIDDPYEPPEAPDLILATERSPAENVALVTAVLDRRKLIGC